MRISTAQIFGLGVDSIQHGQKELARIQQQLGTGKRMLAASDDPAGAVQALKLRERIDAIDQYARNATMGRNRLQQEETVLTDMGNALQRVRVLTLQAANSTVDDGSRAAIARELRQIEESLLASGNTRDANGEYMFAGNRTAEPPFVQHADGTIEYRGDAGERRIALSPDRSITVARSGEGLMTITRADDTGSLSLFEVVGELAAAFETPVEGDEGAHAALRESIDNGLTHLDSAIDRVLDLRTDIGARLNTIESHGIVGDAQKVELKAALSTVEDLDYAEAISRFSLRQVALQAAQQTYVQLSRLSLFDFIR